MRYIILRGIFSVLLTLQMNIFCEQEILASATAQQSIKEQSKNISPEKMATPQEPSAITEMCIEHVAYLIAQAKKNRCLAPAHANQLQGEYSTATPDTTCEYKVLELADQKTVFLLAKIEAKHQYDFESWVYPPAWFATHHKDELADKLHAELDKEFKNKKSWRDVWLPFQLSPDKLTRCTYFARGNKVGRDIHHYIVEIGQLPKETLAALVQAAQQKKEAKDSLRNSRYPELHPIVM